MQEVYVETGKDVVVNLEGARRLKISIRPDDCGFSPRENDNLGTMVCWHRRYNLGDEEPSEEPTEWRKSLALSLDNTLEDRLWHWHSGPGWHMLDNKHDAEAARLYAVAVRREAEAATMQEATNTVRERAKGLLNYLSVEPDEYDMMGADDLAAMSAEAATKSAEAEVLAARAADLEHAATTMRREARQARDLARKTSDWAAINEATEREEEAIDKVLDEQIAVILPLYLYDHGGITMRAHPFSCQWDSGQVGWIFVTKADVKINWSLTRMSQKARDHAERILRAEVEEYAAYLEGRVYGYTWEVEESETCECCETTTWTTVDQSSVWGFIGWPMDYMIPDDLNPQLEQYGIQIRN